MNRRTLLKFSGLAVVGLATAPLLARETMKTARPSALLTPVEDAPGFILTIKEPDAGFFQRNRVEIKMTAPDGESISCYVTRASLAKPGTHITPEMDKWADKKLRTFYHKPRRSFWRTAA